MANSSARWIYAKPHAAIDYSALLTDAHVLVDSTSVVTQSGVNAMVERQTPMLEGTGTVSEYRLNVAPTARPDRKTIDLAIEWSSTSVSDAQPSVTDERIVTSVVALNDNPLVLLVRSGQERDYLECVVLTATILNERGERKEHAPKGDRKD